MLAPRRIAFINEKGGSAKTTLAANVAAYLALRRGRRVLAVDMDPQGQLGKVLGVENRRARRSAIDLLLDTVLGPQGSSEPGEPARSEAETGGSVLPVSRTHIPRLDVIAANKSLALFSSWEKGLSQDASARLSGALDAAPEVAGYDFILFDAPPSFGPLTLNVLCAAREIVVPVPLTYLALDGCAELLRTIALVRSRYGNPELRVVQVVPTFHRRTRLAQEVLDRLKTRFPKEISSSVVGYHVKIDEAQSRGLSIFEYAPGDRGARVMAELAEELELRGIEPDEEAPR